MSTKEKLIERFKCMPNDFTFHDMKSLLQHLGYEMYNKGKTSGSRVIFKDMYGHIIMLHKPHPGSIVKHYAMKQVLEELKFRGKI